MNPDYSLLLASIDYFRNKHILCIGDVMLDRYVYGDVNRISPEAPIPVFAVTHEESMLGAAGNVAKNIAALGAHVSFYSAVGDDKYGIEIKRLLAKEKNISCYLSTEGQTTVKTRYLSGNQQLMRIDEDNTSFAIELPEDLRQFDAVIISDYDKGACSEMSVRDMDIPCVVDTKAWLGQYTGAMVVTPNLGELAASVDWFRQNASDADVIKAAREIITRHDIENVLVTRASKGMTLQTYDNQTTHIPAVAKEVYDVVGAGDTVAAILALGLACGLSVLQAAVIANIAGGIVVGKRGTATCSPMELKTSLLALNQNVLN